MVRWYSYTMGTAMTVPVLVQILLFLLVALGDRQQVVHCSLADTFEVNDPIDYSDASSIQRRRPYLRRLEKIQQRQFTNNQRGEKQVPNNGSSDEYTLHSKPGIEDDATAAAGGGDAAGGGTTNDSTDGVSTTPSRKTQSFFSIPSEAVMAHSSKKSKRTKSMKSDCSSKSRSTKLSKSKKKCIHILGTVDDDFYYDEDDDDYHYLEPSVSPTIPKPLPTQARPVNESSRLEGFHSNPLNIPTIPTTSPTPITIPESEQPTPLSPRPSTSSNQQTSTGPTENINDTMTSPTPPSTPQQPSTTSVSHTSVVVRYALQYTFPESVSSLSTREDTTTSGSKDDRTAPTSHDHFEALQIIRDHLQQRFEQKFSSSMIPSNAINRGSHGGGGGVDTTNKTISLALLLTLLVDASFERHEDSNTTAPTKRLYVEYESRAYFEHDTVELVLPSSSTSSVSSSPDLLQDSSPRSGSADNRTETTYNYIRQMIIMEAFSDDYPYDYGNINDSSSSMSMKQRYIKMLQSSLPSTNMYSTTIEIDIVPPGRDIIPILDDDDDDDDDDQLENSDTAAGSSTSFSNSNNPSKDTSSENNTLLVTVSGLDERRPIVVKTAVLSTSMVILGIVLTFLLIRIIRRRRSKSRSPLSVITGILKSDDEIETETKVSGEKVTGGLMVDTDPKMESSLTNDVMGTGDRIPFLLPTCTTASSSSALSPYTTRQSSVRLQVSSNENLRTTITGDDWDVSSPSSPPPSPPPPPPPSEDPSTMPRSTGSYGRTNTGPFFFR